MTRRLLKELLVATNPWANNPCKRTKCLVCDGDLGEIEVDCLSQGLVYEVWCTLCMREKGEKHLYLGETSRSLVERAGKHMDMLRNQSQKNFMVKHIAEHHMDLTKQEWLNLINWEVCHHH